MTDVQQSRWYVFQTGGNQEFFVERQLNRKRFDTWVPFEIVDKTRNGVVIGQERRALFRSYGFVRFNISTDHWRPITSTYGVKRLFGTTPDKPTPVRDGVVEELQHDFDLAILGLTKEYGIVPDPPIEEAPPVDPIIPDRMAEVLRGPMAGHVGLVKSTSRSRAKLLMHILGEELPVTFKLVNVRMTKQTEQSDGTQTVQPPGSKA